MTGVRVKPLAWAGDNSAMTPFGGYSIGDRPGPRDDWDHFGWSIGDDSDGEEFASPDAAKAAAQADYETRILAALEPQDAPAMAGVEIPAGYTPGPWWTDGRYDGREMGCPIIAARTDAGPLPGNPTRGMVAFASALLNTDARRCEANARLIALAPAMAEELVALRAILSDAREHISSDREVLPQFFSGPNTSALMAKTDALLARIAAALTPEAKS